jgi:hypothetical protein
MPWPLWLPTHAASTALSYPARSSRRHLRHEASVTRLVGAILLEQNVFRSFRLSRSLGSAGGARIDRNESGGDRPRTGDGEGHNQVEQLKVHGFSGRPVRSGTMPFNRAA